MRLVIVLAALALPMWAQSGGGIPGVIADGVRAELVQEGFMFIEGPVGMPDGGLYFTDIPAKKILRLDPSGKITTVRENTEGANGLALNAGELYAAEGGGKLISRGNQNGRHATVVDSANGQPLDAPNDLIFDPRGGFYFTDPGGGDPFHRPAGDFRKVYYVPTASGQAPLTIDDKLIFPNGLTLTLDGKTLLVDDTMGDTIWAYDIQPKGGLKKRAFAKIPQLTEGKSLADGMCIDREGRVYVTSGAGVQVFDKKGKFLGAIKIPREPSNCAFSGPDKRTLYVTAREGLYKLKMNSQGPLRDGK